MTCEKLGTGSAGSTVWRSWKQSKDIWHMCLKANEYSWILLSTCCVFENLILFLFRASLFVLLIFQRPVSRNCCNQSREIKYLPNSERDNRYHASDFLWLSFVNTECPLCLGYTNIRRPKPHESCLLSGPGVLIPYWQSGTSVARGVPGEENGAEMWESIVFT